MIEKLDPGKPWALVDVVGRIQELAVDASGNANIPISTSPVYVLRIWSKLTSRNTFQTCQVLKTWQVSSREVIWSQFLTRADYERLTRMSIDVY